jgi:hypothetical protein
MLSDRTRRLIALGFVFIYGSLSVFDVAAALVLFPSGLLGGSTQILQSPTVTGRCQHQGGLGASDHCAPSLPAPPPMAEDHSCCQAPEQSPASSSCHAPAPARDFSDADCRIVAAGCTCAAHAKPISLSLSSPGFKCLEPPAGLGFSADLEGENFSREISKPASPTLEFITPPPEIHSFS